MRLIILLAVFSSLAACKTIGPCDFSPSLDGWQPTKTVPVELVQIADHAGPWYINDKGQYLACLKDHGQDLCGGGYMIYVKSGSSYSREDFVVCTAMHVPPNNSFKPKPLRGSA
jgi:hypothetical protein